MVERSAGADDGTETLQTMAGPTGFHRGATLNLLIVPCFLGNEVLSIGIGRAQG
jgi:hypothetical protein